MAAIMSAINVAPSTTSGQGSKVVNSKRVPCLFSSSSFSVMRLHNRPTISSSVERRMPSRMAASLRSASYATMDKRDSFKISLTLSIGRPTSALHPNCASSARAKIVPAPIALGGLAE